MNNPTQMLRERVDAFWKDHSRPTKDKRFSISTGEAAAALAIMTEQQQLLEIAQSHAELVKALVRALKRYKEVGDQCSRGYLAECEKLANQALKLAESAGYNE